MEVVGYVYECDFWCANCLKEAGIDLRRDDISAIFSDSDCDYPRHCGDCQEFLGGALTWDGEQALMTNYRDGAYRAPGGGPDEQFEEYMHHFDWSWNPLLWHFIWTFVGFVDPYGDIEG